MSDFVRICAASAPYPRCHPWARSPNLWLLAALCVLLIWLTELPCWTALVPMREDHWGRELWKMVWWFARGTHILLTRGPAYRRRTRG